MAHTSALPSGLTASTNRFQQVSVLQLTVFRATQARSVNTISKSECFTRATSKVSATDKQETLKLFTGAAYKATDNKAADLTLILNHFQLLKCSHDAVATACFSCSPPDLNFLVIYFISMYMHNDHCHRVTAQLQLINIIIIITIITIICSFYITSFKKCVVKSIC